MRKTFLFFLLLFFGMKSAPVLAKGAYAAAPSNTEMVEAPTAYTLLHGGYQLLFRQYENGGVFLKGDIGFQEWLMFGFSLNATRVVGQGDIEVQNPRLGIKVKFLKEPRFPFSVAIGWDDRGYGSSSSDGLFTPGLQKRLFLSLSREWAKPLFFQWHVGVNLLRADENNKTGNAAAYTGLTFALVRDFFFNLELDKLGTDWWQGNAGFVIALDEAFRIGMDFRDIQDQDLFSRILRIQYLGFF